MTILLVEDEKLAREQLEQMVLELAPDARIAARFDSVARTVAWLRDNPAPDLVFLDIQLADDLSFAIFEQIELRSPVIFTTAFDQYAIRAFKVNSIDYLLKPVDRTELAAALQKFRENRRAAPPPFDITQLAEALRKPAVQQYQERFMVSRGERLLSIPADQVAWFEGEDRYVWLMSVDGKRYPVEYKLSDLEGLLDPRSFFRLNRSFIARFEAIKELVTLSKSRVKVVLSPLPSREVIVSSERTAEFKHWLNQ